VSTLYTELKYQGEKPLNYQYILNLKSEGQEGKINIFRRWVTVGGGRHKERVNDDEYGECTLYSYMKIEE
jgi:hypothetical protein